MKHSSYVAFMILLCTFASSAANAQSRISQILSDPQVDAIGTIKKIIGKGENHVEFELSPGPCEWGVICVNEQTKIEKVVDGKCVPVSLAELDLGCKVHATDNLRDYPAAVDQTIKDAPGKYWSAGGFFKPAVTVLILGKNEANPKQRLGQTIMLQQDCLPSQLQK